MKLRFVILIYSLIAAYAVYAINFNFAIHSDPRESYLYQTLNDVFDIGTLSNGNPFILYAGGHSSYPWIMVVCEKYDFVIYSGILEKDCSMLSKFKENRNNPILSWAFNDMMSECPECETIQKDYMGVFSFGLIYVDDMNRILYRYDTDWTYKDNKCTSQIRDLLNYLMMNYFIGFRGQ